MVTASRRKVWVLGWLVMSKYPPVSTGLRLGAVRRAVLQQEELDLRVGVERESPLGCLRQRPAEHVPRIGPRRRPVRHGDVAEHASRVGRPALRLGQDLKGRWIGPGEHVALTGPGESLDRRAVEADTLLERAIQFRRGDGDGLERSQYVGEPQADEADLPLLEGVQDEFLLTVHSAPVLRSFIASRLTRAAPALGREDTP